MKLEVTSCSLKEGHTTLERYKFHLCLAKPDAHKRQVAHGKGRNFCFQSCFSEVYFLTVVFPISNI